MEPEKKSHGALIGSIIVVLLLIIGVIYIWQTRVKEMKELNQQIEEQIKNLNAENMGELDTLETEINNTDITLDTEIVKEVE